MSEYWESLTTGKKIKIVLVMILSIFILTFAIVNWQESEVNFIFFRLKISITLLILICACVGYLISTLFEYRHYNEKVKEINLLNAEINRLNQIIEKSKEVPSDEEPSGETQVEDEII